LRYTNLRILMGLQSKNRHLGISLSKRTGLQTYPATTMNANLIHLGMGTRRQLNGSANFI
jgi:hypothetical protein